MNALTSPTAATTNFLTPTSLQEAMQIADILASSDIVPKDYQRKPGNILVAMQWGAEIGLQPLQAMQNIAVINGRPSIWGDAMLALVRGSGLLEFIREELSDDEKEAICTVKRKGEEATISKFSMEDAKRAGLSTKQGPWSQYPKRMMKLRARSYALRDVFPDVLKGMAIAEEEQDKEIDVTPNDENTTKANSGSSALKKRLATKNKVVNTLAVDLTPYKERIQSAESIEELKQVGVEIKALGLGEPEHTDMANLYRSKMSEFVLPDEEIQSIVTALDNAKSIEELANILGERFEPFTSKMTDKQIDLINKTFDAQEAALSE
ncbi:recombinase RecT [Acinetobacter boissieri]|uniref:RecT family protein n=1 Tax=Acinetobacter boissieri TaxID=1219383 RepID=A0A1G6IR52_9GAMM|nr:recombinase RecT [Acinetobacter boissieri]SDC08910.1 RecT family protein [Acinetobacter boissieri]